MAGMNTESLLTPFEFQPSELFQRLQAVSEGQTGYWKLCFSLDQAIVYLAIAQGRVVFAGPQLLSWPILLQALQRYIPQLRAAAAREAIEVLEQNASEADHKILSEMLLKLESATNINHSSITEAIQTQILSVCERSYNNGGDAVFTPAPEVFMQSPFFGIPLETLSEQTKARHQEWSLIRKVVPSLEAIPILNPEALEKAPLAPSQKQQIEKLTSLGKSLRIVAQMTAKDTLSIAKTFANLVRSGLVSLQLPDVPSQGKTKPEIFIVDDSTLFLQQFRTLVSSWGYQVHTCHTTDTAIETMIAVQPDLMFFDINMPGLSGFDLIKVVRREAKLLDKKLVLLTAENSLSNQWRAKWGNCKFLSKPRTPEEIASFQHDLKQLLQEMVPVG
jgi:CheY-like chemotaxis protein